MPSASVRLRLPRFTHCADAGLFFSGFCRVVAVKGTPTRRLTHILPPNITRSDLTARATLTTSPPAYLGVLHLSHDSDLLSSLSDVQSIGHASDRSRRRTPNRISRSLRIPLPTERRLPYSHALPPTQTHSDADADAETGSVLGSGTDTGGRASNLADDRSAVPGERQQEARRAPRCTAAYCTRATM